jgi:hypothetical protein
MPTAIAATTILDYLEACGTDQDRFDFDHPDRAYAFGNQLRENAKREGVDKRLFVEISNSVVRVKVT